MKNSANIWHLKKGTELEQTSLSATETNYRNSHLYKKNITITKLYITKNRVVTKIQLTDLYTRSKTNRHAINKSHQL